MIKKLLNKQGGFTLVELLIVIAVIGILAVAVLAALDPIEQLRKSRDTGKLADSRELVGAYQRFYASYNCLPEDWDAGVCTTTDTVVNEITTATDPDLEEMIAQGELKQTYVAKNSVANGHLRVEINDERVVSVCFPAESKSARGGGMGALYAIDDTTGVVTAETSVPAACDSPYDPVAIDSNNCNICVQ